MAEEVDPITGEIHGEGVLDEGLEDLDWNAPAPAHAPYRPAMARGEVSTKVEPFKGRTFLPQFMELVRGPIGRTDYTVVPIMDSDQHRMELQFLNKRYNYDYTGFGEQYLLFAIKQIEQIGVDHTVAIVRYLMRKSAYYQNQGAITTANYSGHPSPELEAIIKDWVAKVESLQAKLVVDGTWTPNR